MQPGLYSNVNNLLWKLKTTSGTDVKSSFDDTTGKLTLGFQSYEGLSFRTKNIPNMLGFDGIPEDFDGTFSGVHIGHKQVEDPKNDFQLTGKYPMDITSGTNLIFIYINIIEYQHVADTKAPLLRVFKRSVRLKDGGLQVTQTQDSMTFKDLQFKPIMISNVQSLKVELRTENGQLIPFIGSGQTTLTLKFKRQS